MSKEMNWNELGKAENDDSTRVEQLRKKDYESKFLRW